MHVASYQAARNLLQTPPLRSIYVEEFGPGTDVQSDEDVEAYLKPVVNSDSHEVGTMAMMPEALGGVVDLQFRVYGPENVRVTDASVIPTPTSSHMEFTIYILGEKAAQTIIQGKTETEWGVVKPLTNLVYLPILQFPRIGILIYVCPE